MTRMECGGFHMMGTENRQPPHPMRVMRHLRRENKKATPKSGF